MKPFILTLMLPIQLFAAPVLKVKSGLETNDHAIGIVQLLGKSLMVVTDIAGDLKMTYKISHEQLKSMNTDSLGLAQSLMNKSLNITLYCAVDYSKIDPKEKAFECEGVTLLVAPVSAPN